MGSDRKYWCYWCPYGGCRDQTCWCNTRTMFNDFSTRWLWLPNLVTKSTSGFDKVSFLSSRLRASRSSLVSLLVGQCIDLLVDCWLVGRPCCFEANVSHICGPPQKFVSDVPWLNKNISVCLQMSFTYAMAHFNFTKGRVKKYKENVSFCFDAVKWVKNAYLTLINQFV